VPVLQVVGLVRRCVSEQLHEAVRSLAQDTLQRWTWQLTGHMKVGQTFCAVHLGAGALETCCLCLFRHARMVP
jgi:hypothetical protein